MKLTQGTTLPLKKITPKEKFALELEGARRLAKTHKMPEILSYFKEFRKQKSPEAIFVSKMDRLDCLMQSKVYSKIIKDQALYDKFAADDSEIIFEFGKYLDGIK